MIRDIPSHLPPARPDIEAFRAPDKTRSRAGYVIWRVKMWVEGTFGLAVLEPWEKVLLVTIFMITCVFLVTGIIRYLPQRVLEVKERAAYYLFGNENAHGSGSRSGVGAGATGKRLIFRSILGKNTEASGGNPGTALGEL